jgi:hypothetical protein
VHMLGKWLQILVADDGYTPGPVLTLCSLVGTVHSYTLPGLLATPAVADWLHDTLAKRSVTPHARLIDDTSLLSAVLLIATYLLERASRDMFDEELALWLARSAHGVDGMVAILQACLVAMDSWPAAAQKTSSARTHSAMFAATLCRLVPLAPFFKAWRGPPPPRHLVVVAARLLDEQDDPVVQLFRLVSHSAWAHRCHGPACINSRFSAGTHTRQCGQCRRATYCSPDCQRAAWEHPDASHRDVCKILQVLDENKEEERECEIFGIMRDKISWDELYRALESVRSLRVTQFERLRECPDHGQWPDVC